MQITITRPDDWHLHLRDGEALASVLAHTARQFGRAIVMPNLKPPVTTVEQAAAYRDRIVAALPAGACFEPLMTLYLTDNTPASEVAKASETLSDMERVGLPLLVHGEVTDQKVDLFDREKVFIDTVLLPLTQRFPKLKVVMEHITTKDAAEFVASSTANVAATITAHHLLYNRNAIFQGGVRPHWYCLPVLKRETHREALVAAAISGNPKFFLGTDSAPHAKGAKEAACGCAGCYTAYAAIELYAEAFEQAGALDKLEGFASHFGPDWYGLPRNADKITLVKEHWTVPADYPYLATDTIVPLRAGETLSWKML